MFRVTQATYYRQAMTQLMRMEYGQAVLNEQVSSGKQVNRPSDNPVLAVPGQHSNRTLDEIEQYKKCVDHALSWVRQSESKMQSMNDQLQFAMERAEQLATGTYTAEQRSALASEALNIIDTLINLANTSVNGSPHFFRQPDLASRPCPKTCRSIQPPSPNRPMWGWAIYTPGGTLAGSTPAISR